MSGLIVVENVMNIRQFSAHVLTANEEAAGATVHHFATLRRPDHWSPITTNADAWIKCTFDRLRAWNFIALWDHNLLGEALRVQGSDDDFSATGIQTAFDATLPAGPAAGSVDDALGVVTHDKMWLKRVDTRTTHAVRLFIPLMGAGQRPAINGIVGLARSFTRERGDFPESDEKTTEQSMTEAGYKGEGLSGFPRTGVLSIRMRSVFEWEAARYHLHERYRRSPAVLVFDEQRAEQAILVKRPDGRQAPGSEGEYFYGQLKLAYAEHEPREYGT